MNEHFGIADTKKIKFRTDFAYSIEEKPVEKDYAFILTRLVPPKKNGRALRLFVPETIAFS